MWVEPVSEEKPKEEFLSRWSRLKQQARETPASSAPATPDPKAAEAPPELPPVEELGMDSDYRGFFHPKVNEDLRRTALKKLFSDPHFNVMDGLDTYIEDYSKPDPLPAAMLAQLKQAQKIIEWANEKSEQGDKKEIKDEERTVAVASRMPPGGHEESPALGVQRDDATPAAGLSTLAGAAVAVSAKKVMTDGGDAAASGKVQNPEKDA